MKDDRIKHNLKTIVRFCDSIGAAIEYFGKDEEDFLENEFYQNSCCFALLQIGELAKRLPDEFIKKYPGVEWPEFARLRDLIAHSYHKANMHRIWIIMTDDVPVLISECKKILDRF